MAGRYVVKRITQDDIDRTMTQFPLAVWSGLAHAAGVANGGGGVFQGWTAQSRADLSVIFTGAGNLADRNNLPPHRYLQLPPGVWTAAQTDYIYSAYWPNDLHRPSSAGFGVVGLSPLASAEWQSGQKRESLRQQCIAGPVSIEVYYLGKKEMV